MCAWWMHREVWRRRLVRCRRACWQVPCRCQASTLLKGFGGRGRDEDAGEAAEVPEGVVAGPEWVGDWREKCELPHPDEQGRPATAAREYHRLFAEGKPANALCGPPARLFAELTRVELLH